MSQIVEKQAERTGYPVATGIMTIVSACLFIVSESIVASGYPSQFLSFEWPGIAATFALDILAVVGGAFALARKHLVFAVFGASILVAATLPLTAFMISSLLLAGANPAISIAGMLYVFVNPAALVLSTLSLFFLAKSRPEFV